MGRPINHQKYFVRRDAMTRPALRNDKDRAKAEDASRGVSGKRRSKYGFALSNSGSSPLKALLGRGSSARTKRAGISLPSLKFMEENDDV